MPRHKFNWVNLPVALLKACQSNLQLDGPDPAEALRETYGARSDEDFVAGAWVTLREQWLARDPQALASVVDALWQPGGTNGYLCPQSTENQLAWLRQRKNTGRLRAVVLAELIATGEGGSPPPRSAGREPHGTDSALSDQIFGVEGFQAVVTALASRPAVEERPQPYPFERAARGTWNVARWRRERFQPYYPGWAVEVLDANGDPVHGRTLLSTVRASYDDNLTGPIRTLETEAPRAPERGTLSRARSQEHPMRPEPPHGSQAPGRSGNDMPPPAGSKPPTTAVAKPAGQPERPRTRETTSSTRHQLPKHNRTTMNEGTINNHAGFVWSVADLLRGDYKQSEYGRVILPLTVLRRLDCVLEPTKSQVLERAERLKGRVENIEPVLCAITGHDFYNTSPLDLRKVLGDPGQVAGNLRAYVAGFSPAARDILDKFDFDTQVTRLDKANLLYLVLGKFVDLDLHPDTVSNLEMGYLYEELVRRFSELSNETAGEHFTPREVIRLMVNLLFAEDDQALSEPGVVRTLFDPACGTGGMLSVAEDHLRQLNPGARLETFGEEVNAETYAVCKSDLIIKGQDASHIVCGNSFSEDGFQGRSFDYLLANPPFGVEWKKVETVVRDEYEKLGFKGRFGAGLPRINDGSFLFLQHMISKMKPRSEGGSRLAIVFNGSPLFTGAAGSGESEIRRWIIENDWLEAVVALPDQLFYNTAISTYFWVVTNRKAPHRRGKVQLVDAREFWVKMRKSLGDKRKEISPEQVDEITRLYADFTEGDKVKIFPNAAFGFQRITVERPLRLRWEVGEDTVAQVTASKAWARLSTEDQDQLAARLTDLVGTSSTDAKTLQRKLRPVPKAIEKTLSDALAVRDSESSAITNSKGEPEPDPELRDNENVPLPATPVRWEADPTDRMASIEYRSSVDDYVATEVLPYVPDAWVDHSKTKLGYEIPLTRHFYKYVPPRPLEDIDAEIKRLEAESHELLRGVLQ